MDRSAVMEWFAFREGTPEQQLRCIRIRTAMMGAVDAYLSNSTVGPEQTRCVLKAKEAMMAMIGHVVSPFPHNAD